ncbi:MAG TPA: 2-succinyl-6-hydroxy-2,4-cyclohexadiene-1-carboxylate synthase, partial [Acidimicrobiaceae bacterium]|nr:2-succinyl-6-hydroxy-2,4-cyclohexadiene-1-carboxylate synthase [Acidimicrobiaceae bacterium]
AVTTAGAAAAGAPVLLLHGFTGDAESLAPLTERLARSRRCLAVDLVGHGRTESPADVARYSLDAFVAPLDALLDAHDGRPAHVVGYSLGGRAALAFAHARPQHCASLTLVGASAGIADDEQRHARRRSDNALADRIARHGIARFVDEWTALPAWDGLRRRVGPAAWQESVRRRAVGHPLGLAHSLRAAGAGAMTPLWGELGETAVPTLVLAGAEDAKFTRIGRALATELPDARFESVADAGHAAHLEQPDAVADLVLAHVADVTSS